MEQVVQRINLRIRKVGPWRFTHDNPTLPGLVRAHVAQWNGRQRKQSEQSERQCVLHCQRSFLRLHTQSRLHGQRDRNSCRQLLDFSALLDGQPPQPVRLQLDAYFGAPESFDSVLIDGSPRIYWSNYGQRWLEQQAARLAEWPADAVPWVIFDNTAAGSATANAIVLQSLAAAADAAVRAP